MLLTDGLFLFLNACLQYASLEADFSENPVIGDRRQEVWKEVFPFSLVVFVQTLLLCHFCVVLSLFFSLFSLFLSLSSFCTKPRGYYHHLHIFEWNEIHEIHLPCHP